MVTTGFEVIEKEQIEFLKFPESEVLQSQEDLSKRRQDLEKALTLGNSEQIKIRIFFEDNTSAKCVETTVWGVTDKLVILKQGMVIPIHRIHYLQL